MILHIQPIPNQNGLNIMEISESEAIWHKPMSDAIKSKANSLIRYLSALFDKTRQRYYVIEDLRKARLSKPNSFGLY